MAAGHKRKRRKPTALAAEARGAAAALADYLAGRRALCPWRELGAASAPRVAGAPTRRGLALRGRAALAGVLHAHGAGSPGCVHTHAPCVWQVPA